MNKKKRKRQTVVEGRRGEALCILRGGGNKGSSRGGTLTGTERPKVQGDTKLGVKIRKTIKKHTGKWTTQG